MSTLRQRPYISSDTLNNLLQMWEPSLLIIELCVRNLEKIFIFRNVVKLLAFVCKQNFFNPFRYIFNRNKIFFIQLELIKRFMNSRPQTWKSSITNIRLISSSCLLEITSFNENNHETLRNQEHLVDGSPVLPHT